MDSRNRDAKEVLADLVGMGSKPCRLTIAGSNRLDASATAAVLREQWSAIVDLVGFEPRRIVTGCCPAGVEKAARIVAKSVTGKLAAVFHRPELILSVKTAEMLMNIMLSKGGDALLVLARGSKPACANLRQQFIGWQKKVYQVEVG